MSSTADIIDSHAHLDFPRFDDDRREVIRRARVSGVTEIINAGIDYVTNNSTLVLSKEYDFIYPILGLGPNRIASLNRRGLAAVMSQITQHLEDIAGVGEVGLDYFHCTDERLRDRQRCVLQEFVELAGTIDKPLVLHARCAEEVALKMVRECKCVVFHCYSGSVEVMRELLDYGFYVSLATLVCFSQHHQRLAEEVPLKRLIVETDSPFLSPRRGRNEPAFLVDAINTLSEVKKTSAVQIASRTAENARKIFGIR